MDNVKGAAAEVIDNYDLVVFFLIQSVGKGRCCGLVDDTLDLKAGNFSRVFGGLALRIIEVGGNRDDGLGNRFPEDNPQQLF